MKHKRSFNLLLMLICMITVIMSFPLSVSADMGPKPAVYINFENMGDELCYGTLLSKDPSTGPQSVWDGEDGSAQHNENERYSYSALNYKTWKAFVDYQDSDGYYFLQIGWKVSETKRIDWTYYPPSNFKILLYYPETNTFVVSDIYKKYAFNTYYTVDMSGIHIESVEYDESQSSEYTEQKITDDKVFSHKSSDQLREAGFLALRMIITIIIEIVIALIFGLKHKKQLLLITGANAATQIILNVILNLSNYRSGSIAFILFYAMLELIVFAIEAVIYCIWLKKLSDDKKKNSFYIIYALVANIASFGIGLIISYFFPSIA